jgi:hypothetical protein
VIYVQGQRNLLGIEPADFAQIGASDLDQCPPKDRRLFTERAFGALDEDLRWRASSDTRHTACVRLASEVRRIEAKRSNASR